MLAALATLMSAGGMTFVFCRLQQLTKEDALYAAYKQLTKAVPPSREQNWEKVMRGEHQAPTCSHCEINQGPAFSWWCVLYWETVSS